MDTSRQPTRHWDVAPLLVVGVVLGLVGSGVGSAVGAVLSLGGFVLVLAALVRWARHPRQGASRLV